MLAFIVLQYNNFTDTDICLQSLLKYAPKSYIVVVDNSSTDNSYNKLKEAYEGNTSIEILRNSNNGGFSKGNNIGCKYAIKTHKDIDFLCVINNDTYIEDDKIIEKIKNVYEKEQFDILGPMIWDVNKKRNQNPFKAPKNLYEVKRSIKQFNFNKSLNKISSLLSKFYMKYLRRKEKGITAQGAALIFSKNYFEKYTDVFPEISFMYCEESYLYYRMKHDNLKLVFDFGIKINHANGGSTKKIYINRKEPAEFTDRLILENYLKLEKIFIDNEAI